MADAALFIGWGAVVRGREKEALESFNEAMQYNQQLQSRGDIESFESVILEPHGGDLTGFVLVRGDADKLDRLRRSPEFQQRITRAQLLLDNVGVVGGAIGASLMRQIGIYAEEVEKVKGAVKV